MAYVRENTCGSCKNYEYEGENSKGYCSYYRSYYYPDDSCGHWKLSENASSTSSNCFLTSACCEYKGLADDCDELKTLRHFRDTYLKEQSYGQELIELYYRDAPQIVEAINASAEKDRIYADIYEKIFEIVALLDKNEFEAATILYMLMVYKLKSQSSI